MSDRDRNLPAPAERSRGITRRMREAFLEHLRAGYTVTSAAARAGKSRRRFYALAESDQEFGEEMQAALEAGIDRLEDLLVAAAEEGWHEVDVIEERGAVVRRIARHRKDQRLLKKVREWRRPPVTLTTSADVTPFLLPPERQVTGLADVVRLAIETGQEHLLGLHLVGLSEELVDAVPLELPGEDGEEAAS